MRANARNPEARRADVFKALSSAHDFTAPGASVFTGFSNRAFKAHSAGAFIAPVILVCKALGTGLFEANSSQRGA
jgi:hypothetical protein